MIQCTNNNKPETIECDASTEVTQQTSKLSALLPSKKEQHHQKYYLQEHEEEHEIMSKINQKSIKTSSRIE